MRVEAWVKLKSNVMTEFNASNASRCCVITFSFLSADAARHRVETPDCAATRTSWRGKCGDFASAVLAVAHASSSEHWPGAGACLRG